MAGETEGIPGRINPIGPDMPLSPAEPQSDGNQGVDEEGHDCVPWLLHATSRIECPIAQVSESSVREALSGRNARSSNRPATERAHWPSVFVFPGSALGGLAHLYEAVDCRSGIQAKANRHLPREVQVASKNGSLRASPLLWRWWWWFWIWLWLWLWCTPAPPTPPRGGRSALRLNCGFSRDPATPQRPQMVTPPHRHLRNCTHVDQPLIPRRFQPLCISLSSSGGPEFSGPGTHGR